jgi:hypothetical protein
MDLREVLVEEEVMHYHPIPQMPGDDVLTLCEKHVHPEDPAYLCDCDRNQCGPCEEEEEENDVDTMGNLHSLYIVWDDI